MLNRIFKTILVLSICVGISLPTNAAVSVSDGSAFVTKAEFAADLNNLSNRMAQLENSLDAKIDSLVSSYLTRNGIWNGAKQTTLSDSFDFLIPKNDTNIAYLLYDKTEDKRIDFQANEVKYKSYKVVDSCNKSGLIVCNCYYSYSGTYPGAEREVRSTGGTYQMGHYELLFWGTSPQDVYNSNNFGTIEYGYENQNFTGSYTTRWYVFSPYVGPCVSVGFVSKGEPLYINWCFITGAIPIYVVCRTGTGNVSYTDSWKLNINNINIY